MTTKNENNVFENSLLCLIKGLIGKRTTIDLRNETKVLGIIESVDAYMNIHLHNAEFESVFGEKKFFDMFYVQGRNIRYVHIPTEVSILDTIEIELEKYKRKYNFSEDKTALKILTSKAKKAQTKAKLDRKVEEMKKNLRLLK